MNQKDRDIGMKIISQESRELGKQNRLFHNEKKKIARAFISFTCFFYAKMLTNKFLSSNSKKNKGKSSVKPEKNQLFFFRLHV